MRPTRSRRALLVLGIVAAAAAAAVALRPVPREVLGATGREELTVTDRHGVPLAVVRSRGGGRGALETDGRGGALAAATIDGRSGALAAAPIDGRSSWTSLDEISPHVVAATVAVEDRRFRTHCGVDPLATARALVQNVRARRVVSGGSTITQQLARALFDRPDGLRGKLDEAWFALRLERTLTKDEILEQYLNRVPYGNGAYGIGAAARVYFDKPACDLTLGEAAYLAGLPQAPTAQDPFRHPKRAIERRRGVLEAMARCGVISDTELARELGEPPPLVRGRSPFRAPHFVQRVLREAGAGGAGMELRTTLDLGTQEAVESLLKRSVESLGEDRATNAAALVLDTATSEVLAWVGSVDFWDASIDGQVDGVLALRQPGSTLKPFTYGLALERGMTPATVFADLPTYIPCVGGDYLPRNYDGTFHGPVRMRQALACSYNVPAVRALQTVGGPPELLARLHELGFESLDRPAGHYGVGLTLGGADVTLFELTNAYSALGRGGVMRPVHVFADTSRGSADASAGGDGPACVVTTGDLGLVRVPTAQRGRGSDRSGVRVMPEAVALLLTDILSDDAARGPAFGRGGPLELPFDCAAKTGTSKDYRDSWCVGFTTDYTVGVWVGNFDGRPMDELSGAAGAAPVFHDVMQWLHRDMLPEPFAKLEDGFERREVCAVSGLRAGPHCPRAVEEVFLESSAPERICDWHERAPEGVVLRYPPEYAAWAAKEGVGEAVRVTDRGAGAGPAVWPAVPCFESVDERPTQATSRGGEDGGEGGGGVSGGVGGGVGSAPADGTLRVVFPDDGDIFTIDPVLRPEYQTVALEALVPSGVTRLDWIIDGAVVASVDAPFTASWRLERGVHELQAQGASVSGAVLAAAPVRFVVE